MSKHLLTLTTDEIIALNDALNWVGTAGDPVLTRIFTKLDQATSDANATLTNTIKDTLLHSLAQAIEFDCDQHYKTSLKNAAEFVSDQHCYIDSTVENRGGGTYVLFIEVHYNNETYLLTYYDDDAIGIVKSMTTLRYIDATDDDEFIEFDDTLHDFRTVSDEHEDKIVHVYQTSMLHDYFPVDACEQITAIVKAYDAKY